MSAVAPALGPFVDAEAAVVELLGSLVSPPGGIDVETPNDLGDHLPFIKVSRIGGQSDRWNDAARIDVEVFTPLASRTSGVTLAQACQARLLSFPHLVGAGVIDDVATDVSPNEVPWQNTAIRRWTSSYKVTVRR